MRLYLSSFRLGDCTDRLLALRRTERPAAVIANALDNADDDLRAEGVRREIDALAGIGIVAEELDLRDHRGDPSGLSRRLREYEIVWVRGGNVWLLRHALVISGGDRVLVDLLAEDALVYAGYSAGPCVLAPSLRGLEHCDPVEELQRVHGAAPTWSGLGVLDRAFVPHIDSPGHPETGLLGEVAAQYRSEGVPHHTLRDGQVLVVDGDEEALW